MKPYWLDKSNIYNIYYTPYGKLNRQQARAILGEAQNHRCCYCGCYLIDPTDERLTVGGNPPTTETIEHLKPQCQNGKNNWDNLVVACKKCNSSRPSKWSALDYYEYRIRYGADWQSRRKTAIRVRKQRQRKASMERKRARNLAVNTADASQVPVHQTVVPETTQAALVACSAGELSVLWGSDLQSESYDQSAEKLASTLCARMGDHEPAAGGAGVRVGAL